MAFYDEMADVALELITEFGRVVTLTTVTPGEYDPETGADSPGTTETVDAEAVLLDYSLQESGKQYASGSTIERGDKKVIIAAKGLPAAPGLNTTITAGGQVWKIVNVKESNPAGTPIVYEVQARK